LAPWGRDEYRGRRHTILTILGRQITWQAVQHWCAGRRPLPIWAAERWRDHIRSRCAQGLALADELDEHIKKMQAAPKKKPFQKKRV
jgi:hypothetical protein